MATLFGERETRMVHPVPKHGRTPWITEETAHLSLYDQLRIHRARKAAAAGEPRERERARRAAEPGVPIGPDGLSSKMSEHIDVANAETRLVEIEADLKAQKAKLREMKEAGGGTPEVIEHRQAVIRAALAGDLSLAAEPPLDADAALDRQARLVRALAGAATVQKGKIKELRAERAAEVSRALRPEIAPKLQRIADLLTEAQAVAAEVDAMVAPLRRGGTLSGAGLPLPPLGFVNDWHVRALLAEIRKTWGIEPKGGRDAPRA